jgi:CcmD family protein
MNSINKLRQLVLIVVVLVACWGAAAAATQAQPPPSPAQEGFVPIDQLQQKEQLPAAPLVMAAYAAAWLVIFGYVWSIWRRLSQVEQEMANLTQRVGGANRR